LAKKKYKIRFDIYMNLTEKLLKEVENVVKIIKEEKAKNS
jgi:hypothetical protein